MCVLVERSLQVLYVYPSQGKRVLCVCFMMLVGVKLGKQKHFPMLCVCVHICVAMLPACVCVCESPCCD